MLGYRMGRPPSRVSGGVVGALLAALLHTVLMGALQSGPGAMGFFLCIDLPVDLIAMALLGTGPGAAISGEQVILVGAFFWGGLGFGVGFWIQHWRRRRWARAGLSVPMATIVPPPVLVPGWGGSTVAAWCPECDYPLYGLTDSRCPECGTAFEWQDLSLPRYRRHKFLIEDSTRPWVRSFVCTYVAAHRPSRFWFAASLDQPVRVKRLVWFWAACVLLACLVPCLVAAIVNTATAYAAARDLAQASIAPMPAWPDLITPPTWTQLAAICLVPVFWPLLGFLCVVPFRGTFRKAGATTAHVMRCAAYSVPALASIWQAVLLMALVGPMFFLALFGLYLGSFVILLVMGIWCRNLAVAFREHLRVPHALALVVIAHVILLLMLQTIPFAVAYVLKTGIWAE